MKASRIREMAVVSIDDAEKIGSVQDILVNPDGQRVIALRIKPAQGRDTTVVPVEEVASIGRDAITIRDTRGIATEVPTDPGTVYLGKLLGTKVLTRAGDMLGTVAEVEIDPTDFRITGYELSTGLMSDLFGNRKRLSSSGDVHYGKDILMIRESSLDQPESNERYEPPEDRAEVPPSGEDTEGIPVREHDEEESRRVSG